MAPDEAKFYRDLGRSIAQARKAKRLTQERLAGVVGLSRTSVTNIECGRQPVLAHVLVKISLAVGREPEQLLPQDKASNSPPIPGLDANKQKWVDRVLSATRKD